MKNSLLTTTALLLLSHGVIRAQDGNATLIGNGSWATPGIWSSSPAGFAPINGQNSQNWNATVNANTVTVDTAISIQNLLFGGGIISGAQTLTLNGAGSSWTGGMFGGSGITLVDSNAALSISGSNAKQIAGRALNIGGGASTAAATWTGAGNLVLFNGGINVKSNGLFDIQTAADIGDNDSSVSGTLVVEGGGVLRKSVDTGTTSIGSHFGSGGGVTTTVMTNGRVEALAGVLEFVGNSPSVAGTLHAGDGARIDLNTGTTLNTGALITSAGSGRVQNNSTLTVAGAAGVGDSANSIAGLLRTASTLTGNGTLSVNNGGRIEWTGGTWFGSGATQVNSGGVLDLNGTGDKGIDGRPVNIAGTANWNDGNLYFYSGTMTVQGGGLLDIKTDLDMRDNNSSTPGQLTVEGTLRKSAGSATTIIGGSFGSGGGVNATVGATGTVEVQSGTLFFENTVTNLSGSTLNGGTWSVSNGSSLVLAQGSSVTTIGSSGSVILDGAGSSFAKINSLTTNQGGLTLKNDRDFTTAGAFTNSGAVRVEDNTTALTVGSGGSAAYTQTAGETVLVGGALIDASVFNLNGGELKGTGTIASSVITSGTTTIAPGLSPGALTIDGNLTLSAGNTLAMEIGGLTQGSLYDYIDVNGTLTLAGLLDLDFLNGFEDSVQYANVFTLATADSAILGAFSNVASGSRLQTNTNKSFEVWYGAGSLYGANNLVITGAPEPSCAILVMVGCLGLVGRRRRTGIRG